MNRLETGIPGLDALALGGLPRGRTTLLSGTTGSGKTVFALQFLAAGVNVSGEPGVLVTLEERPEALIANTASFEWDLPGLVDSGRIAVVDATDRGDGVVSGGFDFGGLSARIAHAVEETGAKRLVIDVLDSLFLDFEDARNVRTALLEVLRQLRPLGVTTIIAAERTADDGPFTRFGSEEFVADNVVVLRNALEGERRRRTLEVVKFRGHAHLKGEFPFVINDVSGIEVVPFSVIESEPEATKERVSLGETTLDKMCAGGVYRDTVVLVTGPTGAGKTLAGAQFLDAGLDAGERALFVSFEESPAQIARNVASWGFDFMAPQREDRLRILSRYPERMGLEDLLIDIKHEVEEFKPGRVVIDSMTALEHSASPRTFREFGVGLSGYLKGRGVATLMTTTLDTLLGGGESAPGAKLWTIVDSLITLRYLDLEGELRRGILVVKLRGQWHERAIHEYEIGDDGMQVLGPFHGVEGILAGAASFTGGSEPARPGEEGAEPGGA